MVFLLLTLTYFTSFSSVPVVNFKQVNVSSFLKVATLLFKSSGQLRSSLIFFLKTLSIDLPAKLSKHTLWKQPHF